MADIFISYARDDRSKAQLLAQAFEQPNWSVWWDTRLQAGEVWDEAIERELNAAKCVVVLWSKTSVARRWVRAEANDGLQRGILFPVLLEHIQPPLASRLVQAESLVGWSGESSHSGLDRLLAAIEHFLRQQEQRGTATEQKDEESNEPPRPPPRQVGRRKRWMVALLGTGTLAAAVGVAGLFLEVHSQPENALCDGANMLALKDLPHLLSQVQSIDNVVKGGFINGKKA